MEQLPNPIKRDILIYSFPLFLTCLSRFQNSNDTYWLSAIGALLGTVLPVAFGSKQRLVLSAILYFVQLFIPSCYFIAFGFILHQSYNTRILLSRTSLVCLFVSKVEIIGVLCSEMVEVPVTVRFALATVAIFASFYANPPCFECEDPFESMKARITVAKMLNSEYREYVSMKVKKKRDYLKDAGIYLTEILYMVSSNKVLVLFSSFFSFETSELVIFVMGIMLVFEYSWEYLCLILKTNPTPNTLSRVTGTYIVYFIVNTATKLSKEVK